MWTKGWLELHLSDGGEWDSYSPMGKLAGTLRWHSGCGLRANAADAAVSLVAVNCLRSDEKRRAILF